MNDMESIRKMRALPPAAGAGFGTVVSAATALDLEAFAGKIKV